MVIEVSKERCFQIHNSGWDAFNGVFQDAFEKFASASTASEMLGSVSQSQLEEKLKHAADAFRASIETFRNALEGVFGVCYEEISQLLSKEGVSFAVSGDEIVAALATLSSLCEKADSAESKSNLEQSVSEFESFLQEYPFSGKAHCMLAYCLLGLERWGVKLPQEGTPSSR